MEGWWGLKTVGRHSSAAAEGCSWGGGGEDLGETATLKITESESLHHSRAPGAPHLPRDIKTELQVCGNGHCDSRLPGKQAMERKLTAYRADPKKLSLE